MTTVIKHISRNGEVREEYVSCRTSLSLDDYKLRIHGIHGGYWDDRMMIIDVGEKVEIKMDGMDMR